ncbi:MAG: hypothetical protein DLM68_02375 [Hyphomicrobiales bacterium]|nr:MAG: hypothetical protein DLM68_02375 [Hyphomicrobiales bacterium]
MHDTQLDFFTFCALFEHDSSMPWQRLLYHRINFRALAPRMAGFLKLKGNCLRSVWYNLRHRRILGRILERFPIAWNPAIEQESLNINKLEQVLIERDRQLFRDLLEAARSGAVFWVFCQGLKAGLSS